MNSQWGTVKGIKAEARSGGPGDTDKAAPQMLRYPQGPCSARTLTLMLLTPGVFLNNMFLVYDWRS